MCMISKNIRGWLEGRNEVLQEIRPYFTFRDDMAVIDGIILKGRQIETPKDLRMGDQ